MARNFPLPLFLPVCIFFLLSPTAIRSQEKENQILTNCPASSQNFTAGSQYDANLRNLLSSLAATAARNPAGYYNTSVGRNPDQVYGYAQCMSAATSAACEACFNSSIPDLLQRCLRKKQATIRYYSCIIRYSDRRFFSEQDRSLAVYIWDAADVMDPADFNPRLGGLMRYLSAVAASNSSRSAWGRTNYNGFSYLYALAQCTRDLPPTECSFCLEAAVGAIPSCCRNKVGGNVYYPTCNIRFAVHSFYPATLEASPLVEVLSPPPPPSPPVEVLPPPPPPPLPAAGDTPSAFPNSSSDADEKSHKRTIIIIAVAVSCGAAAIIVTVATIGICRWKRRKTLFEVAVADDDEELTSSQSLLFDLGTLRAATNNFSEANKLGQGGFGPVYKGCLPDGQEIAVKRLLTSSSQGMPELRNEVTLVAKLSHRNLVQLLGFCMEEEEKLLVYEYLPKTSLDKHLFDPLRRAQLDWNTRYKIIVGIARGLLYLHEDSRLKIVHRDLKASNILLDGDMNPKISDFGLARLFGRDQSMSETSRIAGTYGYMAPEYAMHGSLSIKSDVFSFGVLVLEIITGVRNSGFSMSGRVMDLINYTWGHWTRGTVLELIDQTLGADYRRDEALRCIHLGLLCVQAEPVDRPIMSTIVLMLSSRSVSLPRPELSAFHVERSEVGLHMHPRIPDASSLQPSQSAGQTLPISRNEASITELYAR